MSLLLAAYLRQMADRLDPRGVKSQSMTAGARGRYQRELERGTSAPLASAILSALLTRDMSLVQHCRCTGLHYSRVQTSRYCWDRPWVLPPGPAAELKKLCESLGLAEVLENILASHRTPPRSAATTGQRATP